MKIGAVAVLCLVPFGAAWAQENSKTVKVEEMFRLTKSEEMMERSITQVRTMQRAQVSKLDIPSDDKVRQQQSYDAINKIINEHLSWQKMKPRFVAIMAESFTDEELDGILAFYKSPAGKAMLEKMPQFMSKTMVVVQDAMKEMEPEIRKVVDESKQTK